MTAPASPCRLYGKLPGHGDFVSRGLSRRDEAALDAVLNAAIEAARDAWGERFNEIYASAQPWLFAGSPGVAIVIPSADRVGRRFPLYLAGAAGLELQAVYDATVDAIAEEQTADWLCARLAALDQVARPAGEIAGGRWFKPDDDIASLPMIWGEDSFTLAGVNA